MGFSMARNCYSRSRDEPRKSFQRVFRAISEKWKERTASNEKSVNRFTIHKGGKEEEENVKEEVEEASETVSSKLERFFPVIKARDLITWITLDIGSTKSARRTGVACTGELSVQDRVKPTSAVSIEIEVKDKDKDKDIEKVEVEVEVHSSNNSRILSHSGNRSRAGHWVERTFKGEWIAVARKSNLFDDAFVVLSDLLLSLKRSFSGEIPWLEIAIEPDGTSRNRYFESRGDAMA
uniref:Uncharacterized protein n=1 Tax=Vespula pensylvanica TaxID=30213 RepID=A0A834PC70_VESPE|nr:hypothetical protein H0235_003613 [Vespula pensylvanica]